MKRIVFITGILVFIFFFAVVARCEEEDDDLVAIEDGNMSMGIALGGAGAKAGFDVCPRGVRTVKLFLAAWSKENYERMYDLLDDESKKDYPFKQAKFDFQFLQFKPYRISLVRKSGEDFEFLLSYGNWKDGDKEIEKMFVSGESFKIIMATKNSPFKKSIASYF